jgi:5-formyl-3-hydroxy-2-methylpyridine 4-carboxylic acid 5-dehydrogenase
MYQKIEIKAGVYRAIDQLIGAKTLVVSDTSGIPISKLQEHFSYPERFCGMHWSNPPHIIQAIEVISGAKTAPATAKAIVDLIESLGLPPVVINRDVPGFVENRILYALLREAIDLVEEGVIVPEALDTCVSWGIGYKLGAIGPMALLDVAGLDIYHSVASFLNRHLSTRADVAPSSPNGCKRSVSASKPEAASLPIRPSAARNSPPSAPASSLRCAGPLKGKTAADASVRSGV